MDLRKIEAKSHGVRFLEKLGVNLWPWPQTHLAAFGVEKKEGEPLALAPLRGGESEFDWENFVGIHTT